MRMRAGCCRRRATARTSRLQIELRYNTSDTQQRIALAVQSMWREVLGVEATLVNEEFQVLLANMRERRLRRCFAPAGLATTTTRTHS